MLIKGELFRESTMIFCKVIDLICDLLFFCVSNVICRAQQKLRKIRKKRTRNFFSQDWLRPDHRIWYNGHCIHLDEKKIDEIDLARLWLQSCELPIKTMFITSKIFYNYFSRQSHKEFESHVIFLRVEKTLIICYCELSKVNLIW